MAKKLQNIILFLALLVALPYTTNAATLSVSPTSGTFEVGDRVTARVIVTSDLPVNAISGVLSVPPIFTIESVSKAASILNFWVAEPNFSRGAGTLQFEGVALGGYNQRTGVVVTLILRAAREGSGSINFTAGQVLANDGQGTDLTSGFGGSSFQVIPRSTPPEPEPEPETEEPEPEEAPEEEPQQPPTLTAPEITVTSIDDQKAILGGSSYPNSQALITFASEDDIRILVQAETDENGNFLAFIPQTLKRGSYQVYAVVVEDDFSYSEPSKTLIVNVGSAFSDVSYEIRLAIALLLVVLLYLFIQSIRHLFVDRRRKSHVKEESKEAQKIVHKAFKLLNKDIAGLAPIREIKKDLKSSEKSIVEEIKDIEQQS